MDKKDHQLTKNMNFDTVLNLPFGSQRYTHTFDQNFDFII